MAAATTTAPAEPREPGETRAACAFTFDMDAETLWVARAIHEPVTLSLGRFGPVEALPRILALLEKAEVRGSSRTPLSSILNRRNAWLEGARLTQQRKGEEEMGPYRKSPVERLPRLQPEILGPTG